MRNRYTKNNNQPLVSIVVPTFDRPNWLPITIQSLLDQSYTNLEILVVNDAGIDVKNIIDGYNDERIKYFVHEKNSGLSASRNTALKNSKGDYLCFLDDDDFYLPLAIEFRMSQIKKFNAEIVYTRALQNILEKQGDQYVVLQKRLYWDSPFHKDLILIQNLCPCCCPLFSRKSWDDSGNYLLDENLDTSEDQDFWNALSRKNDFIELKLVDVECTLRTEPNGNMTGTRNFAKNWPIIYKRWRHTAQNMKWVVENQNAILRNAGINPEDYGL